MPERRSLGRPAHGMREARNVSLESIALEVVQRMEDLLAAVDRAAEQLASGEAPEEVAAGDYQIYLASVDCRRAIVCSWESEEYLDLVSSVALEMGLDLEATARVETKLPEAEFAEGMVTGWFGAYRGVSAEMRNESLEEILDMISAMLEKRGLHLSLDPDDEVMLYKHLRQVINNIREENRR
jgi:signal transduction histidine kinase